MGRENIYRTLSVASFIPKNTIGDLIDFLVASRAYILPQQSVTEAFKTKYSGNSIISDIVHKLTILEKDHEYSLINLPSKSVSLREVADWNFIPFDTLQMKEIVTDSTKALSVIPSLNDKIVINITDITRANGDFSDITLFQNRVVRDFLSRSYYVSKGSSWVSPTFVRYIAKVYNMTIGGQLARMFALSPQVQSFVQTIFCLYFVGKMTSRETAQAFLKDHYKYMAIAQPNDLIQIFSFIEDAIGKGVPDNLIEVCKIIDTYGPAHMSGPSGSRVTLPVINTKMSSLAPESHVSAIAVDYPPYFAYLVMRVLSNDRIGLSYHMKNLNLLNEGKDVFEQLRRNPLFLTQI